MAKIKTLSKFNKLDRAADKNFEQYSLIDYLQPLDEVDYPLYEYIACGWVAPSYDNGEIIQAGEAEDCVNGVYTYMTCSKIGDKYYYLGILPAFKQ